MELSFFCCIFVVEINDIMFQKRQCPDYEFALDYKERLDIAGYKETKIVKEFGKWYVYYKRY